MKAPQRFALLCLLCVAVLNCGREAERSEAPASETLQTSLERYPAGTPQAVELPNGLHGIIKVFVDHSVFGRSLKDKPLTGSYIAQGTGSLVVLGENWVVLTARHVVVPSRELRKIVNKEDPDDSVEFSTLEELAARVVLGSTGIAPNVAYVSRTQDLAALSVPPESRSALIAVLEEGGYRSSRPLSEAPAAVAGEEVEAWGFPARHQPQVKKQLSVSAVHPDYFVLNSSLAPGYSGGPVFSRATPERGPVGLVLRADMDADQTTVLSWAKVYAFLASVGGLGPSEDVVKVTPGRAVVIEGLPFTLGTSP